jgi:hypothetical protein
MPEDYRAMAMKLLNMAASASQVSPLEMLGSLAGPRGNPQGRLDAYRAQNARAGPYMFDPETVQQSQRYGLSGAGGAGNLPSRLLARPQTAAEAMQLQRFTGQDEPSYWRLPSTILR